MAANGRDIDLRVHHTHQAGQDSDIHPYKVVSEEQAADFLSNPV